MNQEDGPESSHSSASPAASSDPSTSSPDPDPALSTMSLSSPETTPPPSGGRGEFPRGNRKAAPARLDASHRFSTASTASSALSASYQSTSTLGTAMTSPGISESAPQNGRPYMSHYRHWSAQSASTLPTTAASAHHATGATSRPSTRDGLMGASPRGPPGLTEAIHEEPANTDDSTTADLAAAVGLLSCSYGTPKTGPVMLPPDVPPVPPLPAQYLPGSVGPAHSFSSHSFTSPPPAPVRRPPVSPIEQKALPFGAVSTGAPAREFRRDGDRDVEMKMEMDDDDRWTRARRAGDAMSDDEDQGMFGRMEE